MATETRASAQSTQHPGSPGAQPAQQQPGPPGAQPAQQQPGSSGAGLRPAAARARRPWSLWAAAALLVLLGALLASTGVSDDDAAVALLPVGITVAVIGVLPLVLRTVGWWLAAGTCVLLTLFVLLGLVGDAGAGLVVGLCWLLLAGGLLVLARPRAGSTSTQPASVGDATPTRTPRSPGEPLPRPEGWTREWAGGWVKFVGMVLFGVLCLLVGLAMTGASLSDDPGRPGTGMSLAVLAFGVTIVSTLPVFWPRRSGEPSLRDLPGGSGISFDYSRGRKRAGLVGACAFALCGIAMAVVGETVPRQVVGVLCTLLFGFFAWYLLRRGGGRWAVVATPAGLGTVDGPGAVVVPWDAVRDVVADETTTYVRGMPNHEPHIAVHTESGAVRHDDAVDSALADLNRRFTDADLVMPVRALGVDPDLVLVALRHYLHHPDQRVELGDRRALERIARGELDGR